MTNETVNLVKFTWWQLSDKSSPTTKHKERRKESEVIQSCLTLCDPVNCSLPGFSVQGILQARLLEWVAISFSRGSSPPRDQPRYPALQADALPSEPPGKQYNTKFSNNRDVEWSICEISSYCCIPVEPQIKLVKKWKDCI